MRSIHSNLAIGLLISLTLVLSSIWYIVSTNIQNIAESYISSRIEHDIETLLSATSFTNNATLNLNDATINPIYKRPFSGHYYTIKHNSNILRSRSLWDKNLSVKTSSLNNYNRSIETGPEDQKLLILTRIFIKQNQHITISIAEDLTPIMLSIDKFKSNFALLSTFILLTFLALQSLILRIGLNPLRKIQNEIIELKKGTIRQLSTNTSNELKSTATEINSLSSSLQNRIERSRNALGDLSHAIKKPLTLLQHFSDDKKKDYKPNDIDFLNQQILSIQQLTDKILKRARIAGATKPHTPFIIKDDLSLLIKTISSMYPTKDITIKQDISVHQLADIEREDILEVLGNLLDNAYKWANNLVSITIKQKEELTITIEDDGPGDNIDALNELTTRGFRLDESVEGYGFGLAISSDIIHDYNGSLLLERSEQLGGFKVLIKIPKNN